MAMRYDMRKPLVSIVIPAYNEEEVVSELSSRLKQVMAAENGYDFEVILVENGSRDSTFEKINDLIRSDARFKMIQLSRNFGCDGGITAGLSCASGDAVVIMNADLQDPPEMIPHFLRKHEAGYEIVYGIIEKRVGVPWSRRVASSMFYKIINWLTNDLFPKNVSDFRLIDRKVCETVNRMQERNRFLRGIIIWTGFKQTGLPYERPARFAGETKANFMSVLKLAFDGIFSFSYFPLRLATGFGVLLAIGSLIGAFIFVVLYFTHGREVPGHTSTVTIMLFFFGMLFIVLGIIGEYLARIYDEVKQRPNFVIKQIRGLE